LLLAARLLPSPSPHGAVGGLELTHHGSRLPRGCFSLSLQVATLQEQVQQLQASLSQGAQTREAATAALQAQVQEQKAEIDALRKQLHSAPSASQMQVRATPGLLPS
jgi:predicted RNase H-like nuclease (RuvC/YqgF family)